MEKWFSGAIEAWYLKNKRDLPWRSEKDAYKIWLSEIILQQTQVVQGLSYYLRFTEAYPTVKHLAVAHEDEVLRLWQGLGYYSRARNLHNSAKTIMSDHKGKFPNNYQDIKALKGVGDYTAAAIASFAYDLPHAVVDGNVYRVLSRVFGIKTPIDSSGAKKEFQKLADDLLDRKNPALYNQAIMEFGSQYCRPVNPDCENCILKSKCYAFKSGTVQELPVKVKKTKIRNRYFSYLLIADKTNQTLIHKRGAGDIWQGLYEFPLLESSQVLTQDELLTSKPFKALFPLNVVLRHVSKEYKHILSHQHLYARFYVLQVNKPFDAAFLKKSKPFVTVSLNRLADYAFPRLIGKFLDDCDLKEMS